MKMVQYTDTAGRKRRNHHGYKKDLLTVSVEKAKRSRGTEKKRTGGKEKCRR